MVFSRLFACFLACLLACPLVPGTARAASRAAGLVAAMTLEEKVGQVFMVWFAGPAVSDDIAGLIRERRLGGVILYSVPGNIESPRQVAALTSGLQAEAAASGRGLGLLVGVDQEGAPVARLRQGFTLFPSQMAQAAAGRTDLTRQAASATARELRAVGINVNFAPVADVNVNPANPVIGIRSFGSEPADVARFTAAATAGYAAAGLICTPKHFPGHGDATVDSHVGLPRSDHDAAALDKLDFPPFRAAFAVGAPAVMTAHMVVPALDREPDLPATLSRRVLEGTLRGRMGFDGVIFTDSLGMGAVADTFGIPEASVRALAAGADVLLIGADAGRLPAERLAAMEAVTEAVRSGRVPMARLNAAVTRVLRLKERYGLLDAAALSGPSADPAAQIGRPEDAALARRIARRSLTAVGPTSTVLPLAAEGCLVIRPRLGREAVDAEAEAAIAAWSGPRALFLPADPDDAAVAQTLEQARAATSVVLLATDLRRRPGQRRLAEELGAKTGPRFVLAATQSPYDLALAPRSGARLATYGEAPASLDALYQGLFAPFRFSGRLPAVLPATPPKQQ